MLAQAGLRVTPQRLALLEHQMDEGGHLSADDLYRRVRGSLPGLSATSIYKTLHALQEAGLVREVHVGGGPVRYDADGGQHHHHRVCRSCGAVDDVPCLAGAGGGCLAEHDLGGFGVEQVEITYRGRCVRCQARPAASDEEAR
jgi:Fur family ferric uptake transcriptional regulator